MEKFRTDHDLHIHSFLSSCSQDPCQTSEAILAYGEKNGFHTLALTDHFWDASVAEPSGWYAPQDLLHIKQSLPLPQGKNCRFLFGAEGDMNKNFQIGIGRGLYDGFGFIIVPTTHLHMKKFTIDPDIDGSDERRAYLWVKRFEALLDSDLPAGKTGIAHLTCSLMSGGSRESHMNILKLLSSDDMARLFTRARDKEYGIELNIPIFNYSEEEYPVILRPYRIAKECGCKFYLGSDAHTNAGLENAVPRFEKIIELLELTEEDKYPLVRR